MEDCVEVSVLEEGSILMDNAVVLQIEASNAENLKEKDKIGVLIALVEAHTVLWNSSHSEYKNKEKRAVAWANIGKVLKTSGDNCMSLWKTLRERYGRELKKCQIGLSDEHECSKKWAYFDRMLFVKPHIIPRKTRRNILSSSPVHRSSSSIECSPHIVTEFPSESNLANSDVIRSPSVNDESLGEYILPTSKMNKEDILEAFSATRRFFDAILASCGASSISPRPNRRIDHLCNLIADRYASLSPSLQDRFDIKVLTLICEFTQKNDESKAK